GCLKIWPPSVGRSSTSATSSPVAAASTAAASPAGPPPITSRSYVSLIVGSSPLAGRGEPSRPGRGMPRLLTARHRRECRSLGCLVELGQLAIALHLAEERVELLEQRRVALLHCPRPVLGMERLRERRLLELVAVRLVELREQVVLDHDPVRAAGC